MFKRISKYLIVPSTVLLMLLIIILANGNGFISSNYLEIECALMLLLGLSLLVENIKYKSTIIKLGLGKTRKELKKDYLIAYFILIMVSLLILSLTILINIKIYIDIISDVKTMILYLSISYIIGLFISSIMTIFNIKHD